MNNDFIISLIASLNRQLSKQRIKNDLKSLDDSLYIKIISRLSLALSKRQLKRDLEQLNDLYLQVGVDLKIDGDLKKKLQDRIKTLQDSIADLQIGINTKKSSDISRSVSDARNKAQRQADKTPINFNLDIKKEKVIADLEYIGKKYSKLFSDVDAAQKYNSI